MLAGINLSLAESPMLGEPATAEEIAKWDIGIMPDGEGLPAGSGTAVEGKKIYDAKCSACHGPAGLGGSADELAGATMKLTDKWPEKTIGTYWPYATTLFDMIRRSMPMTAPRSLSNDEVYAVTAYLLHINGIIAEDEVMNAETLPKVIMPNRDGFINVYKEEKKQATH